MRPCSANAVLMPAWAPERLNRMRTIENGLRALHAALDERSYAAAMSSAYRSAHGPCLTMGFAYFVYVEGVVEEPYPEVLCKEYKIQAALLREIFGNPFHPLPPIRFPASVRGVAGSVYQSQDAGEYLILADALEDSGCLEQHLDSSWLDPVTGLYLPLLHLRQPEHPHAKGCHVVDWILSFD